MIEAVYAYTILLYDDDEKRKAPTQEKLIFIYSPLPLLRKFMESRHGDPALDGGAGTAS